MRSGVNIIGPVFGELGIGEDVRQLASTILSLGIPISIINYPQIGNFSENPYSALESYITNDFIHGCNIFCMPLVESYRFFSEYGCAEFQGRYNVGYAPWELEYWPTEFSFLGCLFDEIWASSSHTYKAFQEGLQQPVYQVPLVVDIPDLNLLEAERQDIQVDQVGFKFLYVFDCNSTFSRKNPHDVVLAFQKAFGQQEDVSLVLKTMHYKHDDQLLDAAIRGNQNITLINDCFSRSRLLALYKECDVYVSLHKAEGFGRTIAEAMLLRKPTIVSNYSGNVDFCTEETSFLVQGSLEEVAPFSYPFWRQNRWFLPDIDSAADQMVECFNHPSLRNAKARAALEFVRYNFSVEAVRETVGRRLSEIFL